MKPKKTGSSRRKLNFAVDRDEIEINSDWVEAVMASPNRPAGPVDEAAFFPPSQNNATGAVNEPGAKCSSVEISAPVAHDVPVELCTPVVNSATDPNILTEPLELKDAVANFATDAINATVAITAPGEESATGGSRRVWRPRSIRRITDGLTPGQYAVYRLMYEAGEDAGEAPRIYTGGYADLRRLTGLSKRGIQNIVAELQTKQVIRIHQKPGYHRTETTSYVVPDQESVLATWSACGWKYAVGKSKLLTP